MDGMDGMDGIEGMNGLAGDVAYPLELINGRAPNDPDVRAGKPGTAGPVRVGARLSRCLNHEDTQSEGDLKRGSA